LKLVRANVGPNWEVCSPVREDELYVAPRVIRYGAEREYPDWAKKLAKAMGQELGAPEIPRIRVEPQFVTLVDIDRRFVQVSDSFCELMGYSREELIGKKYDDFTAPGTTDIGSVYTLFSKVGYMHGLWMFVSREGRRILVRYESWLRPDEKIEGHMEVVKAGC
jgi:PAS domain S-box-containing protein